MNDPEQHRSQRSDWVETTVQEFLKLTDEEMAYIEIKLRLSRAVKDMRQAQGLTQNQFAALVRSSQSRVSKMENGDSSISLDLLVRGLLALGTSSEQLATLIATPG